MISNVQLPKKQCSPSILNTFLEIKDRVFWLDKNNYFIKLNTVVIELAFMIQRGEKSLKLESISDSKVVMNNITCFLYQQNQSTKAENKEICVKYMLQKYMFLFY